MRNRLANIYLCGLTIFALSGCGLFGKTPLDIDGERISVIIENKSLAPDVDVATQKLKI